MLTAEATASNQLPGSMRGLPRVKYHSSRVCEDVMVSPPGTMLARTVLRLGLVTLASAGGGIVPEW